MTVPGRVESTVEIRRAVEADLLSIFSIEKRAFPQPWPFAAFERYLGESGFLVAHDAADPPGDGAVADTVVGYVVADCVPNHGTPLGHVKDIAVHAERRGEGIGAALLRRALATLSAEGAESAKLEVRPSNDPARALYADFGFEYLRTVPRYYDDGEDAFIYVCDLSQQTF